MQATKRGREEDVVSDGDVEGATLVAGGAAFDLDAQTLPDDSDEPPVPPFPAFGSGEATHGEDGEGAGSGAGAAGAGAAGAAGTGVGATAGQGATGEPKAKKKRTKKKKVVGWTQPKENPWVYVTGFPADVTVDEVATHFRKCGILKSDFVTKQPKIKLYTAPDGLCKVAGWTNASPHPWMIDGGGGGRRRASIKDALCAWDGEGGWGVRGREVGGVAPTPRHSSKSLLLPAPVTVLDSGHHAAIAAARPQPSLSKWFTWACCARVVRVCRATALCVF